MKLYRIGLALTVLNFVFLIILLTQVRPSEASSPAPVLRGSAIEIVDSQGRVRASISVEPEVTMNGRTYPETVLFRLTDPQNGPVVKIEASAEGSALGLSDDADGGVLIRAKNTDSFVKVVNRKGQEQVVKP